MLWCASLAGIENKGVDTLKDADEMIKSNFGGHGVVPGSYVGPMPTAPNMEGQQTASNSNSANGGSVNSQDSLWNVKVRMQWIILRISSVFYIISIFKYLKLIYSEKARKVKKKSSTWFWRCLPSKCQKKIGYFFKLCGILRKPQLY